MRPFIKRALQKLDKFSTEQYRDLLTASAMEIDRLETVMDSLPGGILVCDTTYNLVLANKPARRLLSIISFEQGVESVWSVIPDERVAEFLTLTLMSKDKAEEREFDIEVMDIHRLLSVSVMPLVRDHQVSGSLVLVNDITERRSREAKMRRMESLASLTTLASGVAHEIKNPLGALSIHVQLIQKAMSSQKNICAGFHENEKTECEPNEHFSRIDKYLNIVNEEIDRLNGIVVDFLFAVRPMNAKLRRGNVNTLIEELAAFVSFELKETGIQCTLSLDENLPSLDFDPGLLKQALLNLVKNAVGAMGRGGDLAITTETAGDEVHILVADTGDGIPEENLPKIFEPYFTTKDSGTGLGLTLVFKIIKEHEGEISVKSQKGRGSIFTITLPVPQTNRRLIAYEAQGSSGAVPGGSLFTAENNSMESK